ncbi:hypothetical protein [Streptococcus ovis]|uniref:hypothetical protein n=1 Tax=Streptococcus ovis TaxID=82806 RepID=UPI00036F4EDA|nr:hypothetical protein [Streptococcus ovis]
MFDKLEMFYPAIFVALVGLVVVLAIRLTQAMVALKEAGKSIGQRYEKLYLWMACFYCLPFLIHFLRTGDWISILLVLAPTVSFVYFYLNGDDDD